MVVFWIMVDFWIMVVFWIMVDFWIIVAFWIMVDFWIRVDFWIMVYFWFRVDFMYSWLKDWPTANKALAEGQKPSTGARSKPA